MTPGDRNRSEAANRVASWASLDANALAEAMSAPREWPANVRKCETVGWTVDIGDPVCPVWCPTEAAVAEVLAEQLMRERALAYRDS
ncbi:hypothetical protein [Paractinoplanes toevensis]|uniref:Uncharacterized protein n=1 Tax=Paractinoplanes toevensis TaxID=571911 RepID=A0A919TA58_9ACTN|nr:hypothetical protein [Actinoplanes toevensis]GIM90356.1 hypothetical protein Ato02nite_021490 [Actinoplanes toevensis]